MPAILRYRKNLRSISVDVDCREMANRVFPQGAATEGIHKTMARAIWEVGDIDGDVVTLLPDAIGNPIRFDDQLDKLICRRYGTNAEWRVVATSAANQTVQLEDEPDTLQVGDFVQFRVWRTCLGVSGELVYLDRPLSIRAPIDGGYGLVEGVIQRPDVPPVDNLLLDPFLLDYDASAGQFVHWEGVGINDHAEQILGDELSQYGGSTAYIQAVLPGEIGRQSEWVNVYPTFAEPYFSAQLVITVLHGSVRFEMDLDLVGDGSSIITIPDSTLPISMQPGPGVRNNVIRAQRKPILAGIGGINCFSDPEIGMVKRIRLRAQREFDDPWVITIFQLDAGQLIQWPYNVDTIYDFRGSNALWHAANDALDDGFIDSRGVPHQRISVRPLDLYREDQNAWSEERVEVGQVVRIQHPPIGVDVEQRVVDVSRNTARLGAGDSEFELSNRTVRQSHRLTSRLRPRTIIVPDPIEGLPTSGTAAGGVDDPEVVLVLDPDGDGKNYEYFIWRNNPVILAAAGGRFTADIISTIGGTLATGIDPTDVATGYSVELGQGSYRTEVSLGGPSDPLTVNVYTIILYDTATQVQLHQASRAEHYA